MNCQWLTSSAFSASRTSRSGQQPKKRVAVPPSPGRSGLVFLVRVLSYETKVSAGSRRGVSANTPPPHQDSRNKRYLGFSPHPAASRRCSRIKDQCAVRFAPHKRHYTKARPRPRTPPSTAPSQLRRRTRPAERRLVEHALEGLRAGVPSRDVQHESQRFGHFSVVQAGEPERVGRHADRRVQRRAKPTDSRRLRGESAEP